MNHSSLAKTYFAEENEVATEVAPSPSRPGLRARDILIGAGVIGAGAWLAWELIRRSKRRARLDAHLARAAYPQFAQEEPMKPGLRRGLEEHDQEMMDTFPASDPPSSW